jgi:very-short-patch-repair endonuclease
MTVVSSFSAEEMDPTKLNSEGPQMLQRFLAYAESKGTDLGPHARPDVELNPFERDVQSQLTAAGIPLIPQYGASGYWIDFAAQHPERPGQMVLAIEADGAAYHSTPTARNRDRLRQDHLERLGWSFHRIWSQEWFRHREREIERAVAAYKAAVDLCDQPIEMAMDASSPIRTVQQEDGSVGAISDVSVRSGSMPVPRMLPITEYTNAQLVRLIRWIESDTLLRTPEELREAAIEALGYRRRGHRIIAALDAAIASAHRGG